MLEIIHTPLIVVHVIACVFLTLVVLLQPGRGGGLGALGGAGAQQVFGGRGAGNALTKASWITAAIFFATSMTLAYMSSSVDDTLAKRSPAVEPAEPPGGASDSEKK